MTYQVVQSNVVTSSSGAKYLKSLIISRTMAPQVVSPPSTAASDSEPVIIVFGDNELPLSSSQQVIWSAIREKLGDPNAEFLESSRFSAGLPRSGVTMRQARLALLGAGLLDAVGPAIQGLPSPQKEAAEIEWEYSTTVDRNSELVMSLSAAIGITDDQMDALFATAATL